MVQVRTGRPDDQDIVADANLAMAWETEALKLDAPTVRRGVARALSGVDDCFYLIAELADPAGGPPVFAGQLMLTREWSDWRDAWVWWIQSVYVAPAARRRGVYAALYAEARARAAAAGVAVIRLYVDQRNTSAAATYAALGMDGGHYQVFEAVLAGPPRPPTPAGGG
ncbi:MAG: GNAT family N-acetyltransferase [Deltaproteobacteria bacterium]|nr:GNAT family N-acetyltransferase [Deltaproteobacteria bacterium]